MAEKWSETRKRLVDSPAARESYATAKLAFELGAKVREQREARGWTQTELAKRARMTQPAVARFEVGGTIPTFAVLLRLSNALDLRLNVSIGQQLEARVAGPRVAIKKAASAKKAAAAKAAVPAKKAAPAKKAGSAERAATRRKRLISA